MDAASITDLSNSDEEPGGSSAAHASVESVMFTIGSIITNSFAEVRCSR